MQQSTAAVPAGLVQVRKPWLRRLRKLVLVLLLVAGAAILLLLAEGEWTARQPGPPLEQGPARASGPAGAPVLILLHGAGMNGRMWDPVRRHLDPAYRVIALDLPGYGARRGEEYSLARERSAIAAAAHSLAPAKLILVGDSLGGYSAMAAASAIPAQQLRGLILAGSSANFYGAGVLDYLKNLAVVKAIHWFSSEDAFLPKALVAAWLRSREAWAACCSSIFASALPPSRSRC